MRFANLVTMVACVGCVRVNTDVKFVELPEGTRHVKRVAKGSRTYDADVEVDGTNLVLTVTRKELCQEGDVPIIRRKRVITKTEEPGSFGIAGEYVTGVAGLIVGGLALANPEGACTSTDDPSSTMNTNPQECVTVGWGLLAASAVVVGIAVVDSVRVADEEEDLGIRYGEWEAEKHECHAGPLRDAVVELTLGNGDFTLKGKTSHGGEVSFAMIDAWDDVLPSATTPPQLSVSGDLVTLVISEEQVRDLVAALYANPEARVSHDAVERSRERCDAAFAVAEKHFVRPDSADAEVRDAELAWDDARSKCGSLWTNAQQLKLDNAKKAIGENRVGAVVMALNSGDLDRVDELLSTDKRVVSLVRNDPGVVQLLRKTVGEPTRALSVGGKGLPDAQRRLCRARLLFVTIQGADKWNEFKAQVAQNVSELNGGVASNIVRLMDAARCE